MSPSFAWYENHPWFQLRERAWRGRGGCLLCRQDWQEPGDDHHRCGCRRPVWVFLKIHHQYLSGDQLSVFLSNVAGTATPQASQRAPTTRETFLCWTRPRPQRGFWRRLTATSTLPRRTACQRWAGFVDKNDVCLTWMRIFTMMIIRSEQYLRLGTSQTSWRSDLRHVL